MTARWTRFERRTPQGWGWSQYAIVLRDDTLLVHSPTHIDEAHYAKLEALGAPSLLFAPTAVHHLSLERYRQRFSSARAVAGKFALEGLAARKHAGVEDIEAFRDRLPDGADIHCAPGTRWGETWLSFRDDDGSSVLLVCDAFFHVGRRCTGAMGFALRATGIHEGLCIGSTFKWLALNDRKAYQRWALSVIDAVRPTTLLVSHCEPLRDPGLSERLCALLVTL